MNERKEIIQKAFETFMDEKRFVVSDEGRVKGVLILTENYIEPHIDVKLDVVGEIMKSFKLPAVLLAEYKPGVNTESAVQAYNLSQFEAAYNMVL